MTDDEKHIIKNSIEKSIESLIVVRKLELMADSPEFINGLLIGLEIAGLFGNHIHEMYKPAPIIT